MPTSFLKNDIRAMLRIAAPLAFAELGWMSMSVVDNIMVGHLPDSAVAIGAASVGGALFSAFAIFGIALMSGLDTLISHAHGANARDEAHVTLMSGTALALCLAGPTAFFILGLTPLLRIIGVPGEIRAPATGFIRVLVWSMPLLFIYTTFRRYLQGIHYVKPVPFALISANLVNVLGNWVLIYGHWGFPAMGIRGSALSTVLARVYLAGTMVVAVYRRDPDAFRAPRVRWERISHLLRLGLPAALTTGFEVGIFNATTALVAKLGPVSLAAHTIALNAASVTFMVPLGISSAAAVSVGRAVGAKDPHAAARAGWTAIGLGLTFEVCSALAFLLLPRTIARAYTRDDAVISFAIRLLWIAAAFQLFDGAQTVATGALRGLGDTRTPMIWNFVCYWVIGLPVGCWLGFGLNWGAAGFWWELCVALMVIGIALIATWSKRSRVQHGHS
ncbi:MAG TPA: MATE family efflux transporter [Bryobacteraceae bacterium]|nr:MATE family efflux transporter [Bryobacteraceae bacterium]